MVVQWWYSGGTVVVQWWYSGGTVVLQWCYSGVTEARGVTIYLYGQAKVRERHMPRRVDQHIVRLNI
jgi:hypothetical protein